MGREFAKPSKCYLNSKCAYKPNPAGKENIKNRNEHLLLKPKI